jgi:formyl-CoA transferase
LHRTPGPGGPALGQYNPEIYGTLLGLAPEEIAALEAAGTI